MKDVSQIHCLVLRDMDSNTQVSCTDTVPGYTSIHEGLRLLRDAERIYGHSIVHYDLPVLAKLHPRWKPRGEVRDTLLMVQMRFAHQKDLDFPAFRKGLLPGRLIGLHTIEAWGYRLGVKKQGVEISDWSTWTPLMQKRCESDTLIVKKIVRHLIAAKGLSRRAIEIEHELADYLRRQQDNGCPFDTKKASALQATLAGERDKAERALIEEFGSWKKSLGVFIPKRDDKERGYKKGVPTERFKTVEFNPGSRDHIAKMLTERYGWKPTILTDGGRAKIAEETISGLPYPPVPKLLRYLMLDKRLGQLAEGKEAWLKHTDATQPLGGGLTGLVHIHHRVKQNGTITHRAAHASPNLGQVPTVDSPYGPECRALFGVPPGLRSDPWVELGVDVSGLELRCLAHYMARYDDGAYGEVVLAPKGSDKEIHLYNSRLLNIPRPDGKTFIYAYLYGAGDPKLGKIIKPSAGDEDAWRAIGEKARAKFERKLPALGLLTESVKLKARAKGFLKLIDGRRVYIREEHAALNSLLQGTGSIICKKWIVDANKAMVEAFGQQGWDQQWAGMLWVHDEVQLAVRESIKEDAAAIWINAIHGVQHYFSFRLPLDGEAKFGRNWAECH